MIQRESQLLSSNQHFQGSAVPDSPTAVGASVITLSNHPSTPSSLIAPSIQVRSHLTRRFIERVHRLDFRRKWTLILQSVINLSQLVGLITILIITRHQTCDEPLRLYLVIHAIHVSISFPCAIHIALRSSRDRDRNPEPVGRSHLYPRRSENSGWARSTSRIDLRTFHDFLCLTTILWFFLGNYFIFESKTCRTTSKELFYTSIVILALGYLYILEVVFVVLAVMFYFPIVIIGIQLFGWEDSDEMVKPLQKAEIKKIPLVVYVPEEPADRIKEAEDQKGLDHVKDHLIIKMPEAAYSPDDEPREKGRIRKIRSKLSYLLLNPCGTCINPTEPSLSGIVSQTSRYSAPPHPIHTLSPNQSTCAICLTDYSPPSIIIKGNNNNKIEHSRWETLRKLPGCQHCFHRECIDHWLSTSARCPLCQLVVKL
ncbi:hypothetical protein BY996DRAFT_4573185 [Phakopsora pachyrhizi]|uniref:Expressed protein n=1 Tax=Phakopsora pachyrhizi TaxID=170000 RepID=A0AAV0BPU0_PHAPC|nr:hypothetical protein BY996DRAFT_4573185 [Phakopsora pachyrhizi]CAH7689373.1 expressed protein [Phakopsora pachyrhizi]